MDWRVAAVIAGMLGLVALTYFVWVPWTMRRVTTRIVSNFRRLNATRESLAVTEEEIGIRKHGLFHIGRRDYTPIALDLMVRAGAVQKMPDGKLFLLEDKLGLLAFWHEKKA